MSKHDSSFEDAFQREREAYGRLERIANDLQRRINSIEELRVRLINRWKREAALYEKEMLKCSAIDELHVAARYEGIARGYRWAYEDLEAGTTPLQRQKAKAK